jgi:FkbM family methyltransferase
MRNGALLAISPVEGFAPWSVGWTCFEQGAWEPQVEKLLRSLLTSGDVAVDIGATLGYFAAVMSQCVGRAGRVFAFEPVPATFHRLSLCQEFNNFSQLTALPLALGSANGQVEIRYDPSQAGCASIHQTELVGAARSESVRVARLDDLVSRGEVSPPTVIKVDVEGHEHAALCGAAETIRRFRPSIIFEYNTAAAGRAGWTLADVTSLLQSCADYQFYWVEDRLRRLDVSELPAGDRGYSDVLATCATDPLPRS